MFLCILKTFLEDNGPQCTISLRAITSNENKLIPTKVVKLTNKYSQIDLSMGTCPGDS